MSVTRGKFLKELGKAMPGMVLGAGVAGAATRIIGKISAAARVGSVEKMPAATLPPVAPTVAETVPTDDFIKSGPTEGNRIALTFDDGPTPGVTDMILDELKRRGLHATFFMIGERIAEAPELAQRVLGEGHEAGNHTFTHAKLTTLSDAHAEAEIQKTEDIMRDMLAHRAKWFRPPFGALRRNQSGMVTRRGMQVVYWNVDPRDWAQPGAEKIAESVLANTLAGSIILCHDIHCQTVEALGPILDGLLARGLVPSTLSELLEEKGAVAPDKRTESGA